MEVQQILHAMTLEEKIGQKIMLDFRLWQQQDMIEPQQHHRKPAARLQHRWRHYFFQKIEKKKN